MTIRQGLALCCFLAAFAIVAAIFLLMALKSERQWLPIGHGRGYVILEWKEPTTIQIPENTTGIEIRVYPAAGGGADGHP